MTLGAPSPDRSPGWIRLRSELRAAALVGAGAALAAVLAVSDLAFDGGRAIGAVTGRDALAEACRGPLVRRLAERGFEPEEVEFGPAPQIGPPWGRARSFGDSFTFQDGAGQERVDGVVACVVSRDGVRVEFRVGTSPHRAA